MSDLLKIYKCNVCKNVIETVSKVNGKLSCCGENMQELFEITKDIGSEKHVPILKIEDGKLKVEVGEVHHPMENEHYISWIEVIDGNNVYREHFLPGMKPIASFPIDKIDVKVRAYCNIHLLWANK
jgi:superoxide reductase